MTVISSARKKEEHEGKVLHACMLQGMVSVS